LAVPVCSSTHAPLHAV
jgi:hypothetical protein